MSILFDHKAGTASLHFKYATGDPSTQKQEFHYYHEFVLYMNGGAYLVSKGIQQHLTPGSIVLIPKEQFHQFRIADPDHYTRFILGFSDFPELSALISEVMTQVKVISTPSKNVQDIYTKLMAVAKSTMTEDEKLLFVRTALTQLLLYFKYDEQEQIQQNINISGLVQRAIAYIDKHYPDKLTIDSIAQKLYVSPSTLAHNFSKELGISIYRYISKKRLVEVHKLVQQGQSYSQAVTKCGFPDYSCYYRIYKKYH